MTKQSWIFIKGVKKSDACFGNFLDSPNVQRVPETFDSMPLYFYTKKPWKVCNLRAHCLNCGDSMRGKTALFYSTFSMPQKEGRQMNVCGIFCEEECMATFVVHELDREYWRIIFDNFRVSRKAIFGTPTTAPIHVYPHRKVLRRFGGSMSREEYSGSRQELDLSNVYRTPL